MVWRLEVAAPQPLVYRVPVTWLAPVAIPLMAAIGLVAFVSSVLAKGPWWFCALWLGMVGWIGFNLIWRLPYEVCVDDGLLTWRGYRQTRAVPVSDVTRMSLAFAGNVQVVECRDGGKLRIGVMQGYGPFIRSVAEKYPSIPIEFGRYSGFVEKMRLQRQHDAKDDGGMPDRKAT